MSNIVLTSKNRILGVPVKIKELELNEKIVATNATMGMLYVIETKDGEILCDYDEIDENELPNGIPIALPLIGDYKNIKLKELNKHIIELTDLPE